MFQNVLKSFQMSLKISSEPTLLPSGRRGPLTRRLCRDAPKSSPSTGEEKKDASKSSSDTDSEKGGNLAPFRAGKPVRGSG